MIDRANVTIKLPCETTQVEVLLESRILTHQIVCFDSRPSGNADIPWSYVLENEIDIEEAFWRQDEHLTKMAVARRLQVLEGLSNGQRDKLWQMSKQTLVGALNAPAAAAGPAAALLVAAPKAKAAAAPKAGAPKAGPKAGAPAPKAGAAAAKAGAAPKAGAVAAKAGAAAKAKGLWGASFINRAIIDRAIMERAIYHMCMSPAPTRI